MRNKASKRILYGLVAVAFLFIGGRELLTAGLNLEAVAGLGLGALLGFMAITGVG